MKDGGYAKLMHDLMTRKITRNLRRAPETEMLQDQRARAALQNSAIDWFREQLEVGQIDVASLEEFGEESVGWQLRVDRLQTYASYEKWCAERRKRVESTVSFYKLLRDFGLKDVRPNIGGKRMRAFEVPDHETATEKFRQATGVVV